MIQRRGRVTIIAAIAAIALVALLAGLLPRQYAVNDDIGLTEFLREDARALAGTAEPASRDDAPAGGGADPAGRSDGASRLDDPIPEDIP